MRIAWFQPFSGASGDMILGALVDAGLPLDRLRDGLAGLPLAGYRLEAEEVRRGALRATRLRVCLEDAGSAEGGGPPQRHLPHILALLDSSRLPPSVVEAASSTFRRLGEAEARVHGIEIERVHFHEVGAVDSIVDVVGGCLGLHLLGVEEVRCAPIAIGQGTISGSHGTLPIPAPATLELLRGFPVQPAATPHELTTPTGAALLTTLSSHFGPLPEATVEATGYGAGDDRPGPSPNCLRVTLARDPIPAGGDRVVVLESNLDDATGEWLAHLVDRLLEEGALDASLTPTVMKKGRPGHLVTVLAPLDREEALTALLFGEGTTFGLRRRVSERKILQREIETVQTPWGPVRVKVGRWRGEIVNAAAEFRDLREAARRAQRPLREVQRLVESQREAAARAGEENEGSRGAPRPRGGGEEPRRRREPE